MKSENGDEDETFEFHVVVTRKKANKPAEEQSSPRNRFAEGPGDYYGSLNDPDLERLWFAY